LILDPKRNRVPVRMLWMLVSLAGTAGLATAVAAADPHLPVHNISMGSMQGMTARPAPAPTPQATALGRQLIEEIGKGHSEEALALIAAGADVNVLIEGDGTPLIMAARKGNAELVRRLIEAGADVNKAAPGDGNPLIAAANQGDVAAMEMLVRAGADVNGFVLSDETPLINAARRNRLEAARYLIEQGADVNLAVDAPTHDGVVRRSPLGMARKSHHREMEQLLISRGARS
jgi:ankyrin repeat protein